MGGSIAIRRSRRYGQAGRPTFRLWSYLKPLFDKDKDKTREIEVFGTVKLESKGSKIKGTKGTGLSALALKGGSAIVVNGQDGYEAGGDHFDLGTPIDNHINRVNHRLLFVIICHTASKAFSQRHRGTSVCRTILTPF